LYGELDLPGSRLELVIQGIRDLGLEPVFYLLRFTVAQLDQVQQRFPRSRIIGITTPAWDVERECLALLKTRVQ